MKDYFTEGSSGVCVWGIGSKQNTGVSKANSASSHIWLKTISSESILKFSETIQNRWRENCDASMDRFFLPPLLSIYHLSICLNVYLSIYLSSEYVWMSIYLSLFFLSSIYTSFLLPFTSSLHSFMLCNILLSFFTCLSVIPSILIFYFSTLDILKLQTDFVYGIHNLNPGGLWHQIAFHYISDNEHYENIKYPVHFQTIRVTAFHSDVYVLYPESAVNGSMVPMLECL